MVENAFGILKQSFRELLHVTKLNVSFVPDVVVASYLLYNVLLGQVPKEMSYLLEILQIERYWQVDEEDIAMAIEEDALGTDEFNSKIQK